MKLIQKRAMTILAGWFEAGGIGWRLGNGPQLLVEGKQGVVSVDLLEEGVSLGTALAAADVVASLAKGLELFWQITEAAGHGRPQVVSRGTAPKTRASDCDDGEDRLGWRDTPEFTAMRHSDLRRVANLPPSIYADSQYQRIINWYSNRFVRVNARLCQRSGHEAEDVQTYAWMYLTAFYGRWRHLDATPAYNRKMFCGYLQQQLNTGLKLMLQRKIRSVLPDAEALAIVTGINYKPQPHDVDAVSAHHTFVAVQGPTDTPGADAFEVMNHDDMLSRLESKAAAGCRYARKYLRQHRRECVACSDGVTCDNEQILQGL